MLEEREEQEKEEYTDMIGPCYVKFSSDLQVCIFKNVKSKLSCGKDSHFQNAYFFYQIMNVRSVSYNLYYICLK